MAAVSEVASAANIAMDYMKLMIAQMKNQNPLEPMDNNQMATQMAQFSQLQQLETMNTKLGQLDQLDPMNSNFAKVLSNVEMTYADSLLGKDVTFKAEDASGKSQFYIGSVSQVAKNPENGDIMLTVGNFNIGLDEVISVREPSVSQ